MWVEIEGYDTTDGIADFGSDDYFLAIAEAYVASRKVFTRQIGGAQSYVFEADDLKQFGMHWMEAHYQGPLPPRVDRRSPTGGT